MTVYGHPNPPDGATPLVPGLAVDNVTVAEEKNGAMPTRATVRVNGFVVDVFFTSVSMAGKPSCRFDYAGQLLSP